MKKEPRRSSSLKGRDLLSIDDLSSSQLSLLFRRAADIKAHPKKYRSALSGKFMALIFEKPSLRTRTTFTVGITQLGGDSLTLTPADISLGKRESVYDVAKNLERMVDGIMIRTFGHEICTSLAGYASIPVINGLTDYEHPCQAIADFLTLIELKKNLKKAKLCYVGDGNNVTHSLMLTAAKLGATMMIGTPEGYRPSAAVVDRATALAAESGGKIIWTSDPAEAVRDADMVYTDTWTSMGQEAEAEVRRRVFAPYQVNRALFSLAKPRCGVHALPSGSPE